MDQSGRYADLSLKEDDLVKLGVTTQSLKSIS